MADSSMVWHCDSLVQVLALALDSSEAPVGGVVRERVFDFLLVP